MRMHLDQLILARNITKPVLTPGDFQLILQLLSDFLDLILDIEVPAQELADLGVLVVALELLGSMAVRGIDVYIDGAVTVSAPAGLTALADDFGEGPGAEDGVVDQMVNLGVGDVFDAQVVVDEGGEVVAKVGLRGGRGGGEVGEVETGGVLGAVGGIGEDSRVPEVFGVGDVEL